MFGELLVTVGFPLGRAVAGWLENALLDGVISLPEWRRLLATVLKLGVPSVVLFYGFNMDPVLAGAIPLLADYAFSWAAKAYKKVKAKK